MIIYKTKDNGCGWRYKFKYRSHLDLSIIAEEKTKTGWKESQRVDHRVFVDDENLPELRDFINSLFLAEDTPVKRGDK